MTAPGFFRVGQIRIIGSNRFLSALLIMSDWIEWSTAKRKEWWKERAAKGGSSGKKSYNAPYVLKDKSEDLMQQPSRTQIRGR